MGSPFLEHVNVSRNDIQLLSPLTFSQLHRLFDLDISHNNLSQVNRYFSTINILFYCYYFHFNATNEVEIL